jgi:hypothetical protein
VLFMNHMFYMYKKRAQIEFLLTLIMWIAHSLAPISTIITFEAAKKQKASRWREKKVSGSGLICGTSAGAWHLHRVHNYFSINVASTHHG